MAMWSYPIAYISYFNIVALLTHLSMITVIFGIGISPDNKLRNLFIIYALTNNN